MNGAILSSIILGLLSTSTPISPPEVRPVRVLAASNGVKWTGTVRLEEKGSSIVGTTEMTMFATFSGAVPTLHRDDSGTDLNFTDDKGNGGVRQRQEGIVDGKKLSEANCTGSGKAQLHEVAIDNLDKTYRIEVIGLYECKGTFFNHLLGTSEPWNGYIDNGITIPDQPLRDPNVLAGSHTESGNLGGDLGTVSRTFTWNLVRSKPDDVDLIITPTCAESKVTNCTYETWLPEPGLRELSYGSAMKISLKLQGKNGQSLTKKAKAFELHLIGTSTEKGTTINFPLDPFSDTPDLGFLPQANAVFLPLPGPVSPRNIFQTVQIKCPSSGCSTADIKVGSYDGGGWTTLNAVAILQDNTRITGRLPGTNDVDVPIPYRKPGTKIASAWLSANNNPAEMDDKETSTGNSNNGDGLTTYEEYRGVWSEGQFKRLSPKKKELGVMFDPSHSSDFSEGINWFETATDLQVIRFRYEEVGASLRFNGNFTSAHDFDQHVLFIENGNAGNNLGKVYTTNNRPNIPAKVNRVVIDLALHDPSFQSVQARTPTATLPFTKAEYVANTIAHELGHAVNIWHHGSSPGEPSRIAQDVRPDPYRIFDAVGGEILTRPYSISGSIGRIGNQESGNLSCIMAYQPFNHWAHMVRDGYQVYRRVPLLPVGRKMCDSKEGTHFNLCPNMSSGTGIDDCPKYFGDATRGNCLSQIKLRD